LCVAPVAAAAAAAAASADAVAAATAALLRLLLLLLSMPPLALHLCAPVAYPTRLSLRLTLLPPLSAISG